jgi:hypothetical protein
MATVAPQQLSPPHPPPSLNSTPPGASCTGVTPLHDGSPRRGWFYHKTGYKMFVNAAGTYYRFRMTGIL